MHSQRRLSLGLALLLLGCSAEAGSGTAATAATTADAAADAAPAADAAADADADAASAADAAAAGDAATAAAAAADAAADTEPPTPTYQSVTLEQAKALLEADPKPLLINVHVPFEGEITGTDLHISYTDLAGLQAALGDKGRWAILYCKTGPMSLQAVKKLVSLGYWNLLDLPEGFLKWKITGYPFSATKGG